MFAICEQYGFTKLLQRHFKSPLKAQLYGESYSLMCAVWLTSDSFHALMSIDEPCYDRFGHLRWIMAIKLVAIATLDHLPEVVVGVLGRFFATMAIKYGKKGII